MQTHTQLTEKDFQQLVSWFNAKYYDGNSIHNTTWNGPEGLLHVESENGDHFLAYRSDMELEEYSKSVVNGPDCNRVDSIKITEADGYNYELIVHEFNFRDSR